MVWTKFHFGDLTGSTAKIGLLGWTRKPFGDWWQHPIFTPRGLWVFWSSLIASFWRGEVNWHGRPLSWGPCRWILRGLFAGFVACGGDCWVTKTRWAFRVPATGNWKCNFDFSGRYRFSGAALNSIRFRQLHRPVAGSSVFHSWPFAEWRADPVRSCLCVWHRARCCVEPKHAILPAVDRRGNGRQFRRLRNVTNRVVFVSEHNWFHR